MTNYTTRKARDLDDDDQDLAAPETVTGHLTSYLFAWMQHNHRTTLPAPMPHTASEAAIWFAATFCPAPPLQPASSDDWALKHADRERAAYFAECRSTLRGFLSITNQQRHGVLDLISDKVLPLTYRGDSFRAFVEIAAEADEAAADPAEYQQTTLARARAAGRRMTTTRP
jgi:hypothetical protein